MKRKSDEYWIRKIQLFMTLHGIWTTYENNTNLDAILCIKCPHNNVPKKRNCALLMKKNGKRWEYSKKEKKLYYGKACQNVSSLCAEWVGYL